MANGGRNVIGGTFEDIGESVVKPVADEVGKAIEAGVQSVIQGPSAQQTQQKSSNFTHPKIEEQKNLAEARRKLAYWKQIEEAQRKVREEERQKEAQRQQQAQPQQQEKQQIKQFQIVKKSQELHPALSAKGKIEIKRGVGG